MTYAPILIPTLNRYEHLRLCVDSLKANSWAQYTDLIIALDYPKAKRHWDGYHKIEDYLANEDFSAFRSLKVIKRTRNLGAIGNFEVLVQECFEEYDRCICTFDDLEHSPNFIEYMDRNLEAFREDASVVAVEGFSYPVQWQYAPGCNIAKQNFCGSIWGIGYWKDKYNEMWNYLRRGGLIENFDRAQAEGFPWLIDCARQGYVRGMYSGIYVRSVLKRMTDISMRIYLGVEDKYFVMPSVSMVRNHGFDGSGAICEKIEPGGDDYVCWTYNYGQQPINEDPVYTPVFDPDFDLAENYRRFNKFEYMDPAEMREIDRMAEAFCHKNALQRKLLFIPAVAHKIGPYIKRKLK